MQLIPTEERAPKWLLLIGLPIGFVSSLSGIGGGLFASAFLHFMLGMPLRRAVGTGLVLVLATTSAATLTEVLQPSASSSIHWGLTGALVLGALLGANLGFLISERISERTLRVLFALILLYSSVRMLSSSDATAATGAMVFEAEVLHYLWAALIGLGGGIVAPLLGVAGGLVMVPGLFLGLPGFGFDAARASSLAAGVASSARSMLLKHRAGQVCLEHGLLLGLGSLLGSSLGVQALGDYPHLLEYGRQGLGLLLAFIGLRFLSEVLRQRSTSLT